MSRHEKGGRKRWPEGPFQTEGDAALKLALEQLAAITESVLAERARRRWTMAELAVQAGVTEGVVDSFENGRAWTDFDNISRICAALDFKIVNVPLD